MTIENRIQELINEGNKFNWGNFATFSPNNFPDAEKPEFITWKIKAEQILEKTFGRTSPIFETFIKHKEFPLLGYGLNHFDSVKNHVLGALNSGLQLIEYKTEPLEIGDIKNTKKIFIVHGHDEEIKNQIEIFLTEIGLEPIILHRQPDQGQTIIEKFESNSDVSYAFILLTPDDITYSSIDESKPDRERRKIFVARPNVIFEFGFFVGKLGRPRVCCIYKDNVTVPTDLSGLIYKRVDKNIEEVAFSIIKDLKATGIELNI